MQRPVILATVLSLLIGGQAMAADGGATVGSVNGVVRMNTGSGYGSASEGAALRPGDTVMAMSDASSVIRYADGCNVEVKAGSVVTVQKVSPCAVAARSGGGSQGGLLPYLGAGALTVGVMAAAANKDKKPSSP
jgi:hypothetical protein